MHFYENTDGKTIYCFTESDFYTWWENKIILYRYAIDLSTFSYEIRVVPMKSNNMIRLNKNDVAITLEDETIQSFILSRHAKGDTDFFNFLIEERSDHGLFFSSRYDIIIFNMSDWKIAFCAK